MRRLIEFLLAYGTVLGFIGLQAVASVILVSGNLRHGQRFGAALVAVNGRIEAVSSRVTGYFNLGEENARLQAENQRLHSALVQREAEVAALRRRTPEGTAYSALPDSLVPRLGYRFIPGRAIGNTTDRNYNYITLNVGRRHGIGPEMGLITANGVAGLVVAASEDYAVAMSVLNKDFRLSARVRARNTFGTLRWDGGRADEALLENIPLHHSIKVGDTVTVSAYSSIFPEGLMIGRVTEVAPDAGGGFHRVTVRLAADFGRLDYLYAVVHTGQRQLDSLLRGFTPTGSSGAPLPPQLPSGTAQRPAAGTPVVTPQTIPSTTPKVGVPQAQPTRPAGVAVPRPVGPAGGATLPQNPTPVAPATSAPSPRDTARPAVPDSLAPNPPRR